MVLRKECQGSGIKWCRGTSVPAIAREYTNTSNHWGSLGMGHIHAEPGRRGISIHKHKQQQWVLWSGRALIQEKAKRETSTVHHWVITRISFWEILALKWLQSIFPICYSVKEDWCATDLLAEAELILSQSWYIVVWFLSALGTSHRSSCRLFLFIYVFLKGIQIPNHRLPKSLKDTCW